MVPIMAEYVWIDGQMPTAKLRSKTKIVELPEIPETWDVTQLPDWGFDGSSTEQAKGFFSDCGLVPVRVIGDPVRGYPNVIVLCEVTNADGTPHVSNTRHVLAAAAARTVAQEPWGGIEQEYTLYRKGRPFGWPKEGFPHPQGRYYCGVGYDEVHGRPLVEAHMAACLAASLKLSGINAEVMPAQWEFQVGPLPPLELADQLWLARWLLYRIGEEFEAYATLDPKPMPGDWNGAGAHTNFSTKDTREGRGMAAITEACERLKGRHDSHIRVYGADNDQRLTGNHETCDIDTFRYGVSDRGASIRIPMATSNAGRGYLEDRRPAANADPYRVLTAILDTVCGEGFDPAAYGWVSDKHRYL